MLLFVDQNREVFAESQYKVEQPLELLDLRV